MKKLGGIIVGVLGAALAVGGIIAVTKNKQNNTIDTVDCVEENYEIESADVEEPEE